MATRHWQMMASMAGGMVIPEGITFQELLAWAQLTGTQPTPWEVRTIRAMDDAWREAFNGGRASGSGRQHQGVGEYCKGSEVDNCRVMFGEMLEKVCATCPS